MRELERVLIKDWWSEQERIKFKARISYQEMLNKMEKAKRVWVDYLPDVACKM